MKKFTTLLLILIILTGVVSAAFTDADKITEDFTDAVEYMSEQQIITGFPDGSFKPKDTLTRAQAAKIICTMLEGADKVESISASASFADVPAEHWASKFIGYCADKGIVSGVGNNKFNPNGQLTGAAFGKMLLVAHGHDAEKDKLVGENWVINVQRALRTENANYKVAASEDPMKREQACQMAYNFVMNKVINSAEGYKEETIGFTSSNVKLLGKAQMTSDGVRCNYPCDGVEFTVDCKGTLQFTYNAKASAGVVMFVDGKDYLPRANVGTGAGTSTACRFILPGEHTIRIQQDTEINTSGLYLTLTGFKAECKSAAIKPTKANDLYIEFIGDSITAGCCVSGEPGSLYHSGSQSYAFFTAQKLNADYALIAKGSQGFREEKWQKGVSVDEMFLYQNPWVNKTDKAVRARTPDIFVMAMGQNDTEETPDTPYHDRMSAFVKLVRQTLGPKTKIVLIYGMMTSKHTGTVEQVCEELGGAASGYYVFRMPTLNNGAGSSATATKHPSGADNQISSDALVEFLKTNVLK
ncbi:MAG: S-layer homology domain-containing protein [Oscillospiraceae bacterium]|nr:S-layer homology domain-containing protein [Oscillospiraceae bacterium]